MTKSASAAASAVIARPALLAGLAIAISGAVLFSTKAIVAKLMYRYQVDAITVIALRMIFSVPVFAAIAVWQMRNKTPLAAATAGASSRWGWSAITCRARSTSSGCSIFPSGWSG